MKIETARFGWKATINKETISKNMKNFAAMFKSNKTGTPFAIADRVKAFGNEGFVKSVSANGYVEVSFPDAPTAVIFRTDGRLFSWCKCPSLVKL